MSFASLVMYLEADYSKYYILTFHAEISFMEIKLFEIRKYLSRISFLNALKISEFFLLEI